MKLHAISAGDLVRALRLLEARDEAARVAIARVLGFDLQKGFDLQEHAGEAAAGRVVHDGMARRKRRERKADPAPEPQFNPQWTRAIISTMARIRTRNGPPEIERLVENAAERKPMLSVPHSISETASGADVLLDTGEHMGCFSRDQTRLVALMRRVLGSELVSAFEFAGSPVRGVLGETSSELEAYRPRRPGWPVVVLTDLGIGGGAGATLSSEWLEFSRLVRAAGCRLLALVPYPAARWPAGLESSMHIIQWDRASSVRTIKAALRDLERDCP